MNNPTFGIYIPSYKRAKTCYAHKFLEYGTYIVRESEYEEYCEALADFSDHIKVQAVEDHLLQERRIGGIRHAKPHHVRGIKAE